MTIPDFKDATGVWRADIRIDGKKVSTVSGSKWKAMQHRCKAGGWQQSKFPSYIGCVNGFKDCHSFTEWCTQQVGYGELDWHLDKDLLSKGNKTYSPTTCVLLPPAINYLLVKGEAQRGDYPIGVRYRPHGVFTAQCNIFKRKQKYIGTFHTAEAAFAAYKEFKEALLKQTAEEWRGRIDERAYHALMNYEVEITD